MSKHWSEVEYLHQTVQNPNIVIRGTHSYYSNAWTPDFEDYVVRYLYGDKISSQKWQPQWELDKLYIGDYVCIGAETVILMGGNNTHRTDWFSDYPFWTTSCVRIGKRATPVSATVSGLACEALFFREFPSGRGRLSRPEALLSKMLPLMKW